MLTSRDICRLLRRNKYFSGVFPSDLLPLHLKPLRSLIINLDEHYNEGSHWIALHLDRNRRVYYFDSFGRPPQGNILTFIERQSKGYDFNNRKYQGNSSTACGYFCILFVILAENRRKFHAIFKRCEHESNEEKIMSLLKFHQRLLQVD